MNLCLYVNNMIFKNDLNQGLLSFQLHTLSEVYPISDFINPLRF